VTPLVLLLLCLAFLSPSYGLGCVGPRGNDVPWFTMFKMPNGVKYYYSDAFQGLELANDTLSNSTCPLWRTLVAGNATAGSNPAFMYYNDQWPVDTGSNDPSSVYAHAKGVFYAVNDTDVTGFWISHSTPRFPSFFIPNLFPSNQQIYGQSFLCMSLSRQDWPEIMTNLFTNRVASYQRSIPAWFSALAPDSRNIGLLVNTTRNLTRTVAVKPRQGGGAAFTVFAKQARWNDDLYFSLVAPTLRTPLVLETWMRPASAPMCVLPTNTTSFSVNSVVTLRFGNGTFAFKETQDHSKYAISVNKASPWVCVGDINFEDSQFVRGGGTSCISSPALWASLRMAINSTDSCSPSGPFPDPAPVAAPSVVPPFPATPSATPQPGSSATPSAQPSSAPLPSSSEAPSQLACAAQGQQVCPASQPLANGTSCAQGCMPCAVPVWSDCTMLANGTCACSTVAPSSSTSCFSASLASCAQVFNQSQATRPMPCQPEIVASFGATAGACPGFSLSTKQSSVPTNKGSASPLFAATPLVLMWSLLLLLL
jgi:deoxyribonuclease-2